MITIVRDDLQPGSYIALDGEWTVASAETSRDGMVIIRCTECSAGPVYAPADVITERRRDTGVQPLNGRTADDLLRAYATTHQAECEDA